MSDKPVGIEKLTLDNHSLYREVQNLVRLGRSWQYISEQIDVPNVQAICEWVNAYKSPPKVDVYRNAGHIHTVPVKVDYKPDPKVMTDQFIAWKRQHEGAVATRLQTVYAPE